jgi:hypothetical protein
MILTVLKRLLIVLFNGHHNNITLKKNMNIIHLLINHNYLIKDMYLKNQVIHVVVH